jgi:hypothetical protein
MSTKHTSTKNTSTKSSRETPDADAVCGAAADVPNRGPVVDTARHPCPGVNGPAGDAETALLAGAP